MSGINIVLLVGNLGKDPEIRYTQGGNAVGNFSVAIGDRRKDKDGAYREVTEWVDVVVFGKTAENAAQFLAKGSKVHVQGRMQTRKYQDKSGNDVRRTEVVCERLTFLSGRPGGGGDAAAADPVVSLRTDKADSFYDDDLPF